MTKDDRKPDVTPGPKSRIGEDLLGAGLVDAVDGSGAHKPPVVHDLIPSSAGGNTARTVGNHPVDFEEVTIDPTLAADDRPGDHPLHDDLAGVVTSGDRETPGVLGTDRVDTVDDIRSEDSGPLLELSSGETAHEKNGQESEHERPDHGGESTAGMRPVFKWLIGFGLVVVLSVMAFAIFEPVQVLPRLRIGPGFALVDQSGTSITSEDGRGAVTLYTFLPSDCLDDCTAVNETMAQVGERVASLDLGDAEFRRVTVALDTDQPDALTAAAEASGADGTNWRWIGGDDETLRTVVGEGFGVYFEDTEDGVAFDPVYIIVDGNGLVRGDYRYSTLASDTDRLTRHISILAEELRNATGAAALVYEAAHVFLCYP